MYSGGIIWNIERDKAIRINCIHGFFIELKEDVARLGIKFVTISSQEDTMCIAQLVNKELVSADSFAKECEEIFMNKAAKVMEIQSREAAIVSGINPLFINYETEGRV